MFEPAFNRVHLEFCDSSIIGVIMEEAIKALIDLPHHSFWIHEKLLAKKIGLKETETKSLFDLISLLIKYLNKGYIGTAKDNTPLECGIVDLANEDNDLDIHVQIYGRREPYKVRGTLGTTTEHRPRWFFIGAKFGFINLSDQLKILDAVKGETRFLNKASQEEKTIMERRKRNHMFFIRNERETKQYKEFVAKDLGTLVLEFNEELGLSERSCWKRG